jgi:recombination protein RecA
LGVHPSEYNEIIAKINKKYEGSVHKGNDTPKVDRISTGSLELDVAMGGGVPTGRFTRFYGGYSSGKTLSSLGVAREAQKMGLMVAYYNIEQAYDEDYVKDKLGVDTDALTVVEGSTIEEIGEKMEALFSVCHVHIIDSVSQAVSEDELDGDIRDWRPGIAARAWGKVVRRLNERFAHDNTVIMIDQVRVNFKTGAEEAAGGKILDHQSSMTVHFKRGSWLYRNESGYLDEKAKVEKGYSGQSEPSGVEIKARVDKSRVCRPFRTATLRLDLDNSQFDRNFELIKAGKHYGVIRNAGRYYYFTDADGNEIQVNSQQEFREELDRNDSLREDIRMAAIEASKR